MSCTVDFVATGDEPISALGLMETLPSGWTYEGLVDGDLPDLFPNASDAEVLNFAWIDVPLLPAWFTYRIMASDDAVDAADLTGEVRYRTDSEEITATIANDANPAAEEGP